MKKTLSVLLVAWSCGGCSDGAGTSDDAGVTPSDGGSADAAADDAPLASEIVLNDFFGLLAKGTGQIQGKVTFAAGAAPRRVTLRFFAEKYSTSKTVTVVGGEVAFRVTSVAPGKYTLGALVDVDGDGRIEAVDLGGFLGGTATTPILTRAGAKAVDVAAGATVVGQDFGAGKLTCASKLGEACKTDGDCRLYSCVCPPRSDVDGGTTTTYGLFLGCDATTNVCTLPNSCDVTCQPEKALEARDGSCLRDLRLD